MKKNYLSPTIDLYKVENSTCFAGSYNDQNGTEFFKDNELFEL